MYPPNLEGPRGSVDQTAHGKSYVRVLVCLCVLGRGRPENKANSVSSCIPFMSSESSIDRDRDGDRKYIHNCKPYLHADSTFTPTTHYMHEFILRHPSLVQNNSFQSGMPRESPERILGHHTLTSRLHLRYLSSRTTPSKWHAYRSLACS